MLGGSSSSSSSGSSSASGGSNAKKITEGYLHQISILRVLSESTDNGSNGSGRHFQIHEIAEISGLKDERETQRFLYILEGQKLVSPHPAGDFTSRHWYITKEGIRALKTVADSGMA